MLHELDLAHPQVALAFSDALILEKPEFCYDSLIDLATGDLPDLVLPLLRGMAWHGEADAAPLLKACPMGDHMSPIVPQACAWLGSRREIYLLDRFFTEPHSLEVYAATARALLHLGHRGFLERETSDLPEAILPAIGLAGSRADALFLTDLARRGVLSAGGLVSMGMLGDPDSVPVLIDHLATEKAEQAALALSQITGAALDEEVFIPEPIDPGQLSDEELARAHKDGLMRNPNGEPAGEYRTRPCQEQEVWQEWWQTNAERFTSGTRYRKGSPYSMTVLIDQLQTDRYDIRMFVAEELAIRYRQPWLIRWETPIAHQRKAVQNYGQYVARQEELPPSGTWLYQGTVL